MVNMQGYINFEQFFIGDIAGSFLVFLLLFFIMIAIYSAKFKFPNQITFMITIISVFLIASAIYESLLILVVIAVGLFIAWIIENAIKK